MEALRGRAWKYGANIDTDVIIPGVYLKEMDPHKLAEHAMEGLDPTFIKKVKVGDFIVADRNFGCGSSREHAPLALRYAGIKAVLAPSFARIFYRNSIDGGHLFPVEIDDSVYAKIGDGDELELSLDDNRVQNLTKKETYATKPFPDLVAQIVAVGGLLNFAPEQVARRSLHT
jgi:3-isopropylmalate/(R)-2-methylmalate dehydratase small subunit